MATWLLLSMLFLTIPQCTTQCRSLLLLLLLSLGCTACCAATMVRYVRSWMADCNSVCNCWCLSSWSFTSLWSSLSIKRILHSPVLGTWNLWNPIPEPYTTTTNPFWNLRNLSGTKLRNHITKCYTTTPKPFFSNFQPLLLRDEELQHGLFHLPSG